MRSEFINIEYPKRSTRKIAIIVLLLFIADISKTLSAKRKRLTTFTNASMKTSNRKYDEMFMSQQNERYKKTFAS